MRFFYPALALAIFATAPHSEAQVKKKSGLFGFGRNEEQISAGLFPVDAPAASPVQSSAPVYQSPARDNDGIFRGGEPSEIQPVSYVIENGERVEKEVPEKKNFFAFGRKDKAAKTESALLTPVPEANYSQPAEPVESVATPEPISEPRLMQDIPEEAIAQPVEEKKSGGFFSFLPWKKDPKPEPAEEDPVVAAPVVAAPAPAPVVAESAPVSESSEQKSESTMVEVPAFADNDKPKKEKNDRDGILPPLPKIKVPRKPTNYENVETIIEDGEIVGEDESIAEVNVVSDGPASTEPPKIVDGVKTYSSWDDVDARSTSAADKILQKIR